MDTVCTLIIAEHWNANKVVGFVGSYYVTVTYYQVLSPLFLQRKAVVVFRLAIFLGHLQCFRYVQLFVQALPKISEQ